VAIVTGASQGIAIAFGEAGVSVVCAARNVEKLKETCADRFTDKTIRMNAIGVGEIVEQITDAPFDLP
jgi:NADP-dependent 3-hydroxy acid dehydrogenase YdfG